MKPTPKKKTKLHILITAGPTREYFDSVRFISNASSGKMGYAIAAAAALRGHIVTLISGPVNLNPPQNVRTVQVIRADQMAAAARRHFRSADVAIFTAAVSDYRPARRLRNKAPKSTEPYTALLIPTEDIAATLGKSKKDRQLTICFALEDNARRVHAEAKMARKNADAIVLNGPAALGSHAGRFEFLVRGGDWHRWKAAPKAQIAARIIREVENLAAKRGITAPTNRQPKPGSGR